MTYGALRVKFGLEQLDKYLWKERGLARATDATTTRFVFGARLPRSPRNTMWFGLAPIGLPAPTPPRSPIAASLYLAPLLPESGGRPIAGEALWEGLLFGAERTNLACYLCRLPLISARTSFALSACARSVVRRHVNHRGEQ